jgi:acyl-CoA hydrolase
VGSENPLTGEVRKAMRAYTPFVALDEYGKARPVPKLVLETEEDQRRHREAEERRAKRLATRAATGAPRG